MNLTKAQEIQRLIFESRALMDKAVTLLDAAEAALADDLLGGDEEKRREAERVANQDVSPEPRGRRT